MQQIPIYFKSDFKLFIQTEAGFAVPFKFEFYTNMPSRPYIVKFDGHKYHNCELLEDGRLCIAFDDHGFGLGKLMIRQSYYLNDADYASEICDRVIAPQPVVNIDDNLLRSEIVLALSGDDTIEFTSQLPPYYQAGLTPEEHQALIDATVHAEEAAASANEQAGIATEAAKAADEARQALTTAYNEKVAALDADYAQKKSALEADYAGVKDALSSDYASVKAQLDADYAATKEALTTDYATALAGLNDRMTAIESQFSADREAWNQAVSAFITASQASFDGKLTDWQSQVDAAIADITRLQQKDEEQDQKLSELEKKTNSVADYTITPSKNIFNNNTILGYIRSSDYGFNIDSSGKYIATIPIEVKSNCIYYIKRNSVSVTASTYLRCLVNPDDEIGKSPLNYINGNELGAPVEDKPFLIPSDCHYVQAQLVFGEVPTTDDYKKVMIEEIGETYPSSFSPSPYEPYGDNYSSKVKDEAMPESFNNLQDRVKALETADIEVVKVPIQDSGRNVYLNASGSIIESTSGATICYFDVEDGIEYTLKVPKTGNTASIVWAYSNGDTSTATPPEVPIVGNSEPFEGTIKVNSNLGKIVVCYHKAEGQPTLEYIKNKEDVTKKTLKILCFGNSFAQDSMMYVPSILKKICPELELTIGICVIGSCSLARHLVNITNTASEAWTPTNYDYEYSKNGSAWASKSLSGEECLQEENWDVITFQQNGENAGRPVSAWEDNIGKSIRPLQKALYTKFGRTVKLGFILTHGSHDSDTDNLKIRWQNTALNVKKVEEETAFVEIFPYGTAIQNLRTTSLVNLGYGSAKNLLADSAHLQDGIACLCACYTNALKIMQLAGIDKSVFGDDTIINMDFITSNNILGTNPNSLTQDDIIGMSDDNRYLAQLSAIQAMRNPWEITDISAFE